MESMEKLTKELAKIHKDMPHLPTGGQKWLAQNIWWLVLIGVVLGCVAVFAALSGMVAISGSLAVVGGAVGAALGGWLMILTVLSLAVAIAVIVIGALAIAPLKNQEKKGWNLLLLGLVINVIASIALAALSFDFGSLLWSLLVSAIAAYFLFETHMQYGVAKKKKPETGTKKG